MRLTFSADEAEALFLHAVHSPIECPFDDDELASFRRGVAVLREAVDRRFRPQWGGRRRPLRGCTKNPKNGGKPPV